MDHGINPGLVRTRVSQYQREQARVRVAGLAREVVSPDQAAISAVAPPEEPALVQVALLSAAGTGQISHDAPVERLPAPRRSPGARPSRLALGTGTGCSTAMKHEHDMMPMRSELLDLSMGHRANCAGSVGCSHTTSV